MQKYRLRLDEMVNSPDVWKNREFIKPYRRGRLVQRFARSIVVWYDESGAVVARENSWRYCNAGKQSVAFEKHNPGYYSGVYCDREYDDNLFIGWMNRIGIAVECGFCKRPCRDPSYGVGVIACDSCEKRISKIYHSSLRRRGINFWRYKELDEGLEEIVSLLAAAARLRYAEKISKERM